MTPEGDPTSSLAEDIIDVLGALWGRIRRTLYIGAVTFFLAGALLGYGFAALVGEGLPLWPLWALGAISAMTAAVVPFAMGPVERWNRQVQTLTDNMLIVILTVGFSVLMFFIGLAL